MENFSINVKLVNYTSVIVNDAQKYDVAIEMLPNKLV